MLFFNSWDQIFRLFIELAFRFILRKFLCTFRLAICGGIIFFNYGAFIFQERNSFKRFFSLSVFIIKWFYFTNSMDLFFSFDLIEDSFFKIVLILVNIRCFKFFILFAWNQKDNFRYWLVFYSLIIEKVRIIMQLVAIEQVFKIQSFKGYKHCDCYNC